MSTQIINDYPDLSLELLVDDAILNEAILSVVVK